MYFNLLRLGAPWVQRTQSKSSHQLDQNTKSKQRKREKQQQITKKQRETKKKSKEKKYSDRDVICVICGMFEWTNDQMSKWSSQPMDNVTLWLSSLNARSTGRSSSRHRHKDHSYLFGSFGLRSSLNGLFFHQRSMVSCDANYTRFMSLMDQAITIMHFWNFPSIKCGQSMANERVICVPNLPVNQLNQQISSTDRRTTFKLAWICHDWSRSVRSRSFHRDKSILFDQLSRNKHSVSVRIFTHSWIVQHRWIQQHRWIWHIGQNWCNKFATKTASNGNLIAMKMSTFNS